ncbi:MAG: alpha-hydroxy acid oxidase [Candidatus Spyradocola sp.]|nr:alpha-hydroxy acid oxidase [Candidatus Spyradocola sp.]
MDEREKALDTNLITRQYFDEILVEMRHMDGVTPDTTLELYGERFATPVMMAALSHLKGQGNQGDGMVEMAQGAALANCVNWVGMGEIEQFDRIAATGARSIKIIKPYADESMVLSRMERAEAAGALAVGMDLDHSFNSKGEPDVVLGLPMRPRTMKEIEGYVKRTKLPFIIKGVLSAVDARKCLDAGVQGIVVSHHHGILPSVVPPLMVLPEIAQVVGGRIPIFVDCGVMNGMDVFKCLALGATAVSVGRPVMGPIIEKGAQGAAQVIEDVTTELKAAMARTCSPDIRHIDRSLLWRRNGSRL